MFSRKSKKNIWMRVPAFAPLRRGKPCYVLLDAADRDSSSSGTEGLDAMRCGLTMRRSSSRHSQITNLRHSRVTLCATGGIARMRALFSGIQGISRYFKVFQGSFLFFFG